jgi:hypothetical protein
MGGDNEDSSLAGLELAYEKGVLTKEQDFINLVKYFLYKDLPIKAVKVMNDGLNNLFIEDSKKNLDLLSDAYFLAKDRSSGVEVLKRSLEIETDPKTSYKIARFAFESEDWNTAIKFLKELRVKIGMRFLAELICFWALPTMKKMTIAARCYI